MMAYDISAANGPKSNDKGVWIRARKTGFKPNIPHEGRKPPVQTPEAAAARRKLDDKLRSYESSLFGGHAERVARGRW